VGALYRFKERRMTRASHRIAGRMDQLDASGIRKVFDLAASMENPINLSIGQPHFDVPDVAKQAAIEAIRSGKNSYTPTQGLAGLRTHLADDCATRFGFDRGTTSNLVTSGVSGGLMLAMQVLVEPGDEVVFFDPYFVMYAHLTNLAGGVPVGVDTYDSFQPDLNKLADAITDKTRMILVNNPSNPTGATYGREVLEGIAEIARSRDLLVLSDEIYSDFVYDHPFTSMAEVYENTLLLGGYSKNFAMTGWRVGWAAGPAAIIEKMTMLQQYTYVCAPSMAQHGLLALLHEGHCLDGVVGEYREKRDLVYDALGDSFGLVKPGGAFYAFVPAPGGDATAFVTRAIESNVLVIPGNVFSCKDTHFRISYACENDTLQAGLDILNTLV
jgi:aspartate/methionine/tyrosine aminotransferase